MESSTPARFKSRKSILPGLDAVSLERLVNEALDEHLKRKEEEYEVGRYYPSVLPQCLRRQYWHYVERAPPTAEALRAFKVGVFIHALIAEALIRHGVEVEVEPELKLDLGFGQLRGRADLLIVHTEGGDYAIEVKSCARLPSKPYPEHVQQLNSYLGMLKLPKGFLLYVKKTALQLRVFNVSFSEQLFSELIERARKLHQYLSSQELPPPERLGSFECEHCEYMLKCAKAEQLKG